MRPVAHALLSIAAVVAALFAVATLIVWALGDCTLREAARAAAYLAFFACCMGLVGDFARTLFNDEEE